MGTIRLAVGTVRDMHCEACGGVVPHTLSEGDASGYAPREWVCNEYDYDVDWDGDRFVASDNGHNRERE